MRATGTYLAAVSAAAMTLMTVFLAVGRTTSAAIWPAALVASVFAGMAWRVQRPSADAPPAARPGIFGWVLIALGAVFVARTVLWLAWEANGQLYVGSPYNLGDFSLHLTHLRHLQGEVPFWPENPIAAGQSLTYPLGVTLWHLLLDGLGLPTVGAFALASLLGLGFGMAAAWRWGGAFGLAALLLNGGFAGLAVLGTGEWTDWQAALAWKNIPLSMLVTQRGLLYALPAGLWLMWRWNRCLVQGRREMNWLDVWIYTTLPLFHLHTFLALSFFLFTWVLIGPQRKRTIGYGLAAVPVATVLAWLVTGGGDNTGASGPAWGWFVGEGQGAPEALWTNFGPWLPLLPTLAGWLAWRIWQRKHAEPPAGDITPNEAAAWVWPGLALLVFSLFWKLQPWAWDNTKLMLWGWLATTPFVWRLWVAHWRPWARAAACGLLFAGGFVTLIGGLGTGLRGGYPVATLSDVAGATQARALLPTNAVVAATPTYNQPLLLAGQPVVLGYDGHLWSHGIPQEDKPQLLDRLLRGQPGWQEAARKLGVTHIYWGSLETRTYGALLLPWTDSAEVFYSSPAGILYRLAD